MKSYWCIPCKKWHEGTVCDCGVPSGAGANAGLYAAKLNGQLFAQAESAERERKLERQLRAGYDVEPTRHQRKLARQIVADL